MPATSRPTCPLCPAAGPCQTEVWSQPRPRRQCGAVGRQRLAHHRELRASAQRAQKQAKLNELGEQLQQIFINKKQMEQVLITLQLVR